MGQWTRVRVPVDEITGQNNKKVTNYLCPFDLVLLNTCLYYERITSDVTSYHNIGYLSHQDDLVIVGLKKRSFSHTNRRWYVQKVLDVSHP